ncbi:MAG: hypothetical protein ACRDTC_16530 [Pseudonocardiaceae bacterium]
MTASAVPSPPLAIEVRVDVRVGQHAGLGRAVIVDGEVLACLPGLDAPRRASAELLPSWLAALVGLGPRPQVQRVGALITERSILDDFLGLPSVTADGVRAHFAPTRLSARWVDQLAAIPGGVRAHWSVATAPAGSGAIEELGRIEVLDAGAARLWAIGQVPADLIAPEVGARLPMVSFAPTTATAVWTALAELAASRVMESAGHYEGENSA